MPNKHDLYRKVGRRYVRVGLDFTGFPANGYWKVVDGRESLLLPLAHPKPLEALRYLKYVDDVTPRVVEKLSKYGAWSVYMAASATLEALQEVIERAAPSPTKRGN